MAREYSIYKLSMNRAAYHPSFLDFSSGRYMAHAKFGNKFKK